MAINCTQNHAINYTNVLDIPPIRGVNTLLEIFSQGVAEGKLSSRVYVIVIAR